MVLYIHIMPGNIKINTKIFSCKDACIDTAVHYDAPCLLMQRNGNKMSKYTILFDQKDFPRTWKFFET